MDIYNSFICHGHKLETSQMSFSANCDAFFEWNTIEW